MGNSHLIGIGGVGMSALAQALLDAGREVTGADRYIDAGGTSKALAALSAQGVRFFPEDGSGIAPDTEMAIVSSAIESDNPGIVRANRLLVPVKHRAEALAGLLSGRKLLAVAGTCGKSTVTAMLGHILAGAGFDPVVVNGAAVPGWDAGGRRVGSVRPGKGEWAVAEVDESDKSLMAFSPAAAVITNAAADHFGIDETQSLFDGFRARVSGPVVDFRAGAGYKDPETSGWSGSFTFAGRRWTVPAPGLHNIANAAAAVAAALAVGADPDAIEKSLAEFPGVDRRLERVGMHGDAFVIDDYAHNPDKLAAMWQTLAHSFPQGIAVAWRPHGYGPLRKMADALAAMFMRAVRPVDTLVLLDVYDAGGTADRSISTDDLFRRLSACAGRVVRARTAREAESALADAADRGAGALVTAGARDPDLPLMARRLAAPPTGT